MTTASNAMPQACRKNKPTLCATYASAATADIAKHISATTQSPSSKGKCRTHPLPERSRLDVDAVKSGHPHQAKFGRTIATKAVSAVGHLRNTSPTSRCQLRVVLQVSVDSWCERVREGVTLARSQAQRGRRSESVLRSHTRRWVVQHGKR